MDASRNLYAILGIPPEATQEDIREAYRIMARRFHPDANPNEGAGLQFRDIAMAYEILGDSGRRIQYDVARREFRDEPSYFSLRVTPSKRVLTAFDEPQVVYLLVEVVPMHQSKKRSREDTRMNLTLVLDRSTSMRGVRLDKVKIAAQQIIEQLSPDDILSVVTFSDRADVVIPAQPVRDKISLRAQVSMMRADGSTAIYQGLAAGVEQVRKYAGPRWVNHVILLTDGRTYGDEEHCVNLAKKVGGEGISISGMGIGEEWNDEFLDEIAKHTGGTSAYINSPAAVVSFLNDRVRSLGDSFVERMQLSVAPDADVILESAFKLTPNPQPVEISPQPIPIGGLEYNRNASVLIQLQMPPAKRNGFRTLCRLDVTGDVPAFNRQAFKVLSDISVEVAENPEPEDPPLAILDALGKLSLYKMQQKAEAALQSGKVEEATRRLENLATRLLAAGENDLAQMAMVEARRVYNTHMLSEQGRKTLKFGTRMLLALPGPQREDKTSATPTDKSGGL
ncbi:MAG: VWA domain-containing protein [Anaerolineae bacterium]|nr:VWA domain-containing protein [Anaerolineae bacterium]